MFNVCWDKKIHMYTTTQELKSEEFTLNNENIKQEIDIKMTFILEITLQKEHF